MARRKTFTPQQVTVGELHEDGYCSAESDSRLCVYGTLPGETVTAMPFTRKQRKIFARPIEISSSHPDRVEAPCNVADICGGCSLQHLDPDQQILFKQNFVQNTFGEVQPEKWYVPLRGDVGNYRAKARLGVKYVDKKEKVLVGFREKLKPYIVDTDRCHVLKAPVGELLPALAELISGLSIPRDIPQIEVAIGDSSLGSKVALVFRHLQDLSVDDRKKLAKFAEQHSLHIYLQPNKPDNITKLYPEDGNDYLSYELTSFDITFEFLPLDFTQVNPSINEKMIQKAIELLHVKSEDRVLDAFCGIGNFSLPLARHAAHVMGIEASDDSVVRARHNASLNGINNSVFISADLFAESLDFAGLQEVNKVLLDPPRSGALSLVKKLASNLASSKVERVVYVSCNPVSLARDAKILVSNGYKFEGAGVIDMFPHTTHVESIATFSI